MARESDSGSWLGMTRLHASFGTGIRAPDGYELAFTDNPHLKPEKSISFDSGLEQRFFDSRALLDLTYFYNKFEDQIVTLGGSLTNLSTFDSDNLGNSRAQGLEASFRLRPTRSLQVSGEYTLLGTAILTLERLVAGSGAFPRRAGASTPAQEFRRLQHNLAAPPPDAEQQCLSEGANARHGAQRRCVSRARSASRACFPTRVMSF